MHISEFKGKRVLIVGMAKTGVALARLMAEQGALVTINDIRPESEISSALHGLEGLSCRSEFGSHRLETFLEQDLILVSPGVPVQQKAFAEARKQNIPISNDLELAFSLTSAPFLAVAGTNGKTTTTSLLGDIFERAGKRIIVGGNIGTPLSPLVCERPETEFIIAEVSSFQLETIHRFRPLVGIMLNITPDHLDRYASWDEYVEAKARLFANQVAGDFALINAKDAATPQLLSRRGGAGKLLFFQAGGDSRSVSSIDAWTRGARTQGVRTDASPVSPAPAAASVAVEEGVMIQGTDIIVRFNSSKTPASGLGDTGTKRQGDISPSHGCREERICSIEQAKLRGEHNQENILAAVLTAWLCHIDRSVIQKSIEEFSGLSHRIEFVAEIKGVRFIDDSKGTNVDAVIRAIQSIDGGKSIWLILGGRDKGNEYQPLVPLVKDRVKGILAIGESREKVNQFFRDIVPVYCADSLADSFKEAVHRGFSMASAGDSVLLSPACASFDMFTSYAHRGQVFKQLVEELKAGGESPAHRH